MGDRGLSYPGLVLEMRFTPIDPPRVFTVGFKENVQLSDCARVELAPNEQVTFVTESGAEYDVARKSWGFYATPSTNARLQRFNLRAALVKNRLRQFFILLVEKGKESLFQQYTEIERLRIVCWLDDTEALERLEERLQGSPDE